MGIISRKFYFENGIPSLQTVITELKQLTGEEITCENFEEDPACMAEVSSEIAGGGFTLMSIAGLTGYETWHGIGASNYLSDAVAVVLLALGGRYEYASSLPTAAQQPWQRAKQWYRKS
ncbi:hypothetical protein Q5H92_09315 [Hymenobacter sp. M29]|uniref:Uncharacterized protein n=1 Tax=Hymenobacter mellowenesis TaxID=3063995 RepID=A0ABT9A9N4_9BACT|nr:hypothetical protein [Hymenobacter sp. M29]MDO7846553.1 hypothetical protein [Hymenobacter sp. M29]